MSNSIDLAVKCIKNPCKIVKHLGGKGYFKWMPDETYLKICYRAAFGRKLNLANPQTFNEKLQWLKLYDRNPAYTKMVDKYEVKKYVSDMIGEEYIIPTIGVWNHFDEIDFDKLPEQFVLKCTHDSGGLVICKDKRHLDKKAARKKIEMSLKRNFYYVGREWPYKNVTPRIIAEQYMVDELENDLKDYKIHNFNGSAKIIEVDYNRFVEHKRNLYTIDWQYIDAAIQYPTDKDVKIDKPKCLLEMLNLAQKLSSEIPHVRTDFYCINNRIYFGELTFYHESGYGKFYPESFGIELGKWIEIPGGYLVKGEGYLIYLREDKLIEKSINKGLIDYKLMCFNGKVMCAFVVTERFCKEGIKVTFFDRNWNRLAFERHYPSSTKEIKKPEQYECMVMLAERLSRDIPFVRIDFYEVNGKIYLGELTFFPGNGFEEFQPERWDKVIGEWIQLPEKRPTIKS